MEKQDRGVNLWAAVNEFDSFHLIMIHSSQKRIL